MLFMNEQVILILVIFTSFVYGSNNSTIIVQHKKDFELQNAGATRNPCNSTSCRNGGVCHQVGSSFICYCKPPYFGVFCEKDPCTKNPCVNGGTCDLVGFSFKCNCIHPYSGDTCQYVDACSDNPCFNGGTCETKGNSFHCKCRYGYYGNICEKEGYQSTQEETTDSTTILGKVTISTTGNIGNITTIIPGICTKDTDCLNRGICSNKRCKCRRNFGGSWCEINLPCERLQPTCRIMGADCKIVGSKAICDCPTDKMYDPKSGMCEDICDPWRCLHGRCEIDGRTYKCICETGYKGIRCNESIQITPGRSNVWLYIMICLVILTLLLLIQQVWLYFQYRKLSTSNNDATELQITELTASIA